MKRILPVFAMLLLCCGMMHAQTFSSSVFNNADDSGSSESEYDDSDYDSDYDSEDDDDYYDDSSDSDEDYEDFDDYYDENQRKHEENDQVSYTRYKTRKGDQMLKVIVDGNIPLNFGNPWFTADGKMKIGGGLGLCYHYFLTSMFALGADVAFCFNPTIGENIFSHIPIILTATFQPTVGSFEFPISVGVGGAWETYNSEKYWPGLVVKAEAGVYYRINESWSAGGTVSYKFLPQFDQLWGNGENMMGHYVEISASVKYYF